MNIKQLRQTILGRAIRGQLVSQDPTDEPASVLLERIRAEKEELIKEKKLKCEKRDSQPIEEVPFEIPEGWVWCRGNQILNPMKSQKPLGEKFDYIDISSIDNRQNKITEIKTIAVSEAPSRASRKVKFGDTLFSMVRPYLRNIAFVDKKYSNCIASTGFYVCTPNKTLFPKYLFYLMMSDYVVQGLNKYMRGDNSPSINNEDITNFIFPLPPLAEQHRIVQKIEQLFALVDIIEVNKKALEKLIEQAKSQVLSDAVAGKLTHQDPNDEPAEELLKRIGKTTAPDTPYEKMLPKGWAWYRGNQILNPMESQKPLGEKFDYIDISSIDNRQNKITEIKTIAVTEAPSRASRKVKFGDTLFSMVRPYLRNIAFVDKKYSNCIASTGFYVCTPNKTLFPKYLFYLMMSDYVVQGLNKYIKGDNSPSINNEDITNFIFPLPPLKEQPRIVQKIESYFTFFDVIRNNL